MTFIKRIAQRSKDLYGTKPITMAFLGDSVTQGCFEESTYDYECVYHERLKNKLNAIFPSVPINTINAGISGDNAVNGLSRLDRDVLSYTPDLVVVCFGLNDVHKGVEGLDDYKSALHGIFNRLKEAHIQMIFMTPNMMNTTISPNFTSKEMEDNAEPFARIQNEGLLDRYMDCARRVCEEEAIPVCDCYKKWQQLHSVGVDITELLSNYLNHPTRDMHDLFAESLFEMIINGSSDENIINGENEK